MPSLLTQPDCRAPKRSAQPLSCSIPGWAQVALMLWMACFGGHQLQFKCSFDPEHEYVALGSALIDCAAAQPLGREAWARPSQMQVTGGTEALYNSANGYNCSILNDVFGNSVFSIVSYSGGYNFNWNPVYCTAFGPSYLSTPIPINGSYILGTLLNYRGHYVDGIGSYHFGEREYQHPLGVFTTADPYVHAASWDLYSYCNGDPINNFDPDGRFGKGAATGVVLGGFGQYDNNTQRIAGMVGQIGSYFVPGLDGYAVARDVAYSGYSASTAAADIAQNGLNAGNGATFAMSAVGLIPGGEAVKSEATAIVNGLENTGKTITLDALPAAETGAGVAVHGNSLNSLRPTWGYKLFSEDGTFLKNGITSETKAENRYTKAFMSDKYMEKTLYPNRASAYEAEAAANKIQKGILNLNDH